MGWQKNIKRTHFAHYDFSRTYVMVDKVIEVNRANIFVNKIHTSGNAAARSYSK